MGIHDGERVHPESAEQWRAWLTEHADRGTGVWLVSWKKATGRPAMSYEEAVVEALAVGCIDSTAGTLDGERSMLWFAPPQARERLVPAEQAAPRAARAGGTPVGQARAAGAGGAGEAGGDPGRSDREDRGRGRRRPPRLLLSSRAGRPRPVGQAEVQAAARSWSSRKRFMSSPPA